MYDIRRHNMVFNKGYNGSVWEGCIVWVVRGKEGYGIIYCSRTVRGCETLGQPKHLPDSPTFVGHLVVAVISRTPTEPQRGLPLNFEPSGSSHGLLLPADGLHARRTRPAPYKNESTRILLHVYIPP